jgi:hypothetical protein
VSTSNRILNVVFITCSTLAELEVKVTEEKNKKPETGFESTA